MQETNKDANLFAPVLSEKEEIIEIIKPNKKVFLLTSMLMPLLLALILIVVAMVLLTNINDYFAFGILLALGVLMFCASFTSFLFYKNRFYCITDKRVIIRSGLIGIDYKTLNLSTIDAVEVKVSVIDKLCGKNTGTLNFASRSMPMVSVNNSSGNSFSFSGIDDFEKYHKLIDKLVEEAHKQEK